MGVYYGSMGARVFMKSKELDDELCTLQHVLKRSHVKHA